MLCVDKTPSFDISTSGKASHKTLANYTLVGVVGAASYMSNLYIHSMHGLTDHHLVATQPLPYALLLDVT